MKNIYKKKGVSIVELCIAIGIVGILAMMVSANLFGFSESSDAEILRAIRGEVNMAVAAGMDRGHPLENLRSLIADPDTPDLETIADLATEGYNNRVMLTPTGIGQFNLSINDGLSGAKTAAIVIDERGNASITNATGFKYHKVEDGDLVKK